MINRNKKGSEDNEEDKSYEESGEEGDEEHSEETKNIEDMTEKVKRVTGWREWVALPQAGIQFIKAKIDTGARSSSIHAFNVEEFQRDNQKWVRFSIRPWQGSEEDATTIESLVHDRRTVRSSSGHTEHRYVVFMRITLLGQDITAEVTLSYRDEMGFRMLIGRQALRQGFIVDPARSYLGGKASKQARSRNRGRAESTERQRLNKSIYNYYGTRMLFTNFAARNSAPI